MHATWEFPAQQVFIGSTGVIGRVLPVDRIIKGMPQLLTQLSDRGGPDAARAIMTTDLRPKSIALQDTIGGRLITIGGMAKGSGMIHPNMATMLAYFTTDASITKSALQRALNLAVNESFNCISVDGDTSTNDTVLCLANGMAENRTIKEGTVAFRRFLLLLTEACQSLALAICRDGEGVTKVVNIEVTGAATVAQARQVAQTIATSNLVKTALFGEDANWGRVMAAIGRAGVPITPSKLSLSFGGVPMVKKGMGLGLAAEGRIAKVFRQKEFTIGVGLGKAVTGLICGRPICRLTMSASTQATDHSRMLKKSASFSHRSVLAPRRALGGFDLKYDVWAASADVRTTHTTSLAEAMLQRSDILQRLDVPSLAAVAATGRRSAVR